jgi:hypothetical protein
MNTMRIVAIIPMKYGVDSGELTTIKLSMEKGGNVRNMLDNKFPFIESKLMQNAHAA